jgi:D-beta-D-heptose 7-phosphate kinase/D-beta-D-heptose 1-phosphate adenosyltransferase
MDALRCEGVVITQSGNGVVGKQEDYFEIRPREVLHRPESVIGAGDCFISFITMAMARGFSLEDASKIAFAAGTFYVQRKHNSPISPAELLSVGKIKFVKNPSILKKRNFKLVVTNGCFDILHAGHLQTFNFAKSKGDKLCVAINTDSSVSRIKGLSRPVISLENRIKMIEALDVVDYVVCFDEDTPYDLYKNISPDVLVKGGDYEEKYVVGKDLVKELYICPLVEGLSTSKLVAKIKNI